MTMTKLRLAMAAATLLATAGTATAATQGTLGTGSSTGSMDLSVTISESLRITGLADAALGTYGGTGDLTQDTDVCVYTNDSTGDYQITADNLANSGNFEITNANSDALAYTVAWNDATGTTGQAALTANVALAAQTGADTASDDCSTGASMTSNIEVTFAEAALQAAPSGAYTGTLTLVVTPN